MSNAIKTGCLALFVLAATGSLLALPSGALSMLHTVALVVLGLHALEVLVAFKYVKRHPGPLLDSIGLTLLFGLGHWLPLKQLTGGKP